MQLISPFSVQIVVPDFLQLGADLQWLSVFPGEDEILYPPLTFLKPTGNVEQVETTDCDGESVSFLVIEVQPTIGC